MTISEVAARYSRALFDIAMDQKQSKQVLEQIRSLNNLFAKDQEISSFFQSPLVKVEDKERILSKAISGMGLIDEVDSFVRLLAKKGRLSLFNQILEEFQNLTDQENQVTRGVVSSAATLSPEDRHAVETKVSSYIKKNVILVYKEDETLLGGLVARVGSFTFDDSLATHLNRIKEELKRRAH